MKAVAFVVLLAIISIECRKLVQLDKHANTDFINKELGSGGAPAARGTAPPAQNTQLQSPTPTQPKTPVPVTVAVPTVKPNVSKPVQPLPNQIDLKPVPTNAPSTGYITTPGSGNVKHLVTFYDSQGKASVVRPFSYSDAVKKPAKA